MFSRSSKFLYLIVVAVLELSIRQMVICSTKNYDRQTDWSTNNLVDKQLVRQEKNADNKKFKYIGANPSKLFYTR